MGSILTRDVAAGTYRVQFDRPELGVQRCQDTDIMVSVGLSCDRRLNN